MPPTPGWPFGRQLEPEGQAPGTELDDAADEAADDPAEDGALLATDEAAADEAALLTEDAGAAPMVQVNVRFATPPKPSRAVTVTLRAPAVVGVPEITPVCALMERPAGRFVALKL